MSAQISSPKATGGGGTAFEFAVQASFIATMLAQSRYPCLPDGDTEFIRLQAREAGYHTDDVFVQVLDKVGASHRLLVQIKSSCAFTESDTDFREALTCAWDDFTNSDLFDRDKDALLLATGPASAQAIKHFRPLLTWSRSSNTSAEYFGKIATKNFASDQARNYLATIRSLLTNHLAIDPEDADLWVFLRHFHWSAYDFDTDDSQDLSRVIGMLGLALETDSPKGADTVWSECVTLVSKQNPVAGTLTRQQVLDRFPGCFRHGAATISPGIARLAEHSAAILGIVETTLRNGHHVDRSWLIRQLWDCLVDKRQLLIAGAAGSGKSAIIKEMLTTYGAGMPTFVLKADELDRPHIHEALVGIGVTESIETLSQRFGLLRPKLLIVDALEKLLEADNLDAFHQLLRFVSRDDTWMIVLSCRSHALGDIKNEILIPQRLSPPVIEIPLLRDCDLAPVLKSTPELGRLAQHESIMRLLQVPMYLSYASGVCWGEQAQRDTVDDTAFRSQIWRSVIRRDAKHSSGMNWRRERCFVDIAVTRAKAMRPFVDPGPFDTDVVHVLEQDGLLTATDEGIAPAHDLLEDWAIEKHVEVLFREQGAKPQEFFNELGAEPAMRRGFRAWLTSKLIHDDDSDVSDFIAAASAAGNLAAFWRDEVLVATLLSPQAKRFFDAQQKLLLSDGMAHLVRVIRLLRTACKEPDTSKLSHLPFNAKGRDLFASMFLKPVGPGWQAAISFLEQHLQNVDLKNSPTVLGLLQDWVTGIDPAVELSDEARRVGLIALRILDLTREKYRDDFRRDILFVAFRVSDEIRDELHQLFEQTLVVPVVRDDYGYGIPFVVRQVQPEEYRFYKCVTDAAVETFHCSHLCASMPQDVAALARRKWLPTRKPGEFYRQHSSVNIGAYFGLDDDFGFKMHPASALQGPFYFILKGSHEHGLRLVLDLINRTSELYARSGLDTPAGHELAMVTVTMNDGREVDQYLSWRLWAGYRGNTVLPDALQSALMALEKWLFELAETEHDMGGLYDRLLTESCSCATSGVLTSLAIKFPGRIREHMFPLLRTKAFFELDMSRALQEASVIVDVAGMMGLPEQPDQQIHVDERKQAKESDHRKHYLETLVLNLQWSDLREPVQRIIDMHLSSLPPLEEQTDSDRTWRLALHRMDLRKFKLEPSDGDRLLVTPTDPDQDIQEMQARSLPEIEHHRKLAHVNLWSRSEFQKPGETPMPFANWTAAVQWARDTVDELDDETDEESKQRWMSGPCHIAALSIRDHLDELERDDLIWCARQVHEKIMQSLRVNPRFGSLRSGASDGTAASASVLSLLVGSDIGTPTEEEIRLAIAASLTHPDPDVRNAAARCTRQRLWPEYPELARSFLAGMIRFGQLEKQENDEFHEAHRDILDPICKEKEAAVEEKFHGLRNELRSRMTSVALAETIGVPAISLDEWSISHLVSVVHMFPDDKTHFDWEPLLLAIMDAVLTAEEEDVNRKRDWVPMLFGLKRVVADCTAYFSMKNDLGTATRLCAPLCARMDACTEYVADFVEQLIINAEHAADPGHFWHVWHLFADPILDSQRLKSIHMRIHEDKLLRSLLLGNIQRMSDFYEWSVLSGDPSHMAAACAKACQTPVGFEATMGLLYSVGSFFLPNAFRWLAEALPSLDWGKIFSDKGNL